MNHPAAGRRERLMLHRMAWEGFESIVSVPADAEKGVVCLVDQTVEIGQWLAAAAVFEASDAARLYHERRVQHGGIHLSSMPLVPPYPVMWVEYQTDPGFRAVGLHRVGVLLMSLRPDDPCARANVERYGLDRYAAQADFVHLAGIWAERPGRKIRGPVFGAISFTRSGGSYVMMDEGPGGSWAVDTNLAYIRRKENHRFGDLAIRLLGPVCFTIQLLQARNVSQTATALPEADDRRAQRRFGPKRGGYRYHTLTIRINGRPRSLREVAGSGDHGSMPLHWVRGHFKTYTPEAPLLGKYEGTFFWPAFVRGEARNGVVDKTYRIAADAGGNGDRTACASIPEVTHA